MISALFVLKIMSFLIFIFENSSINMNELISVGSLGRNGNYDTVEEVYVSNCSFTNTQNGARIKTWQVKHKDKGGKLFFLFFINNSIILIPRNSTICAIKIHSHDDVTNLFAFNIKKLSVKELEYPITLFIHYFC